MSDLHKRLDQAEKRGTLDKWQETDAGYRLFLSDPENQTLDTFEPMHLISPLREEDVTAILNDLTKE